MTRHPEERAQRASKGDGPSLSSPDQVGGRLFEGGLRPPPQDDGERQGGPTPKKPGVAPGTPSWRKFKFSPELLADCRRRYEQTPESNVSIARDYGISDTTVRRLAQDLGWRKFPVSRIDLPAAVKLRQRAAALVAGQGGAPATHASAFPPPLRGRVREGGPGEDAPSGPTAPPTPDPSPMSKSGLPDFDHSKVPNSGKPEFGCAARMGGGEENAAREVQEASAALAAAIAGVLPGVQQVLAEVRAMRANNAEPRTPLDMQRLAQTYASLNATLQDLQRAHERTQSRNDLGSDYDDLPADLDAFREDLARRIAAFMESRPDDEDAVEAAAGPAALPRA